MFATTLFERKRADKWEELFEETYAVHFYASSSPNKKILRPKFYGKEMPSYAYLGVKHCPISFFSEKSF